MPLKPEGHNKEIDFELWQNPADPPRGIELVTSIAYSIYRYWQDTANLPIRGRIAGRRLPFTDFQYTVEPISGNAKLTPLKLGIVSCYILHNILSPPIWPGGIRAEIWDSTEQSKHAVPVGIMNIKNLPLRTSIDAEPPPGRIVSIPPSRERPWIACWTTFYNFVMAQSSSGSVTEKLRGDWQYDCGQGYRFAIKVYPSAPRSGPYRLIWDQLATTMLMWVEKVSRIEGAYLSPQAVKVRGVEIVSISIIQPRSGGPETGGDATA